MIKAILIMLTFIGIFLLVNKSKIKNKNILKLILIILALEVFVFNFNSFRTVFKKYEKIECNKDEFFVTNFDYDNEKDTYISKTEMPYIEIKGINKKVATIRLDVEILEKDDLDYVILYTDATSKNYRKLPTKTLVNNLERSQYVTCYLSGETDKIAIVFLAEEDLEFKINKIELNKEVPFNFNVFRFSVLNGLAILVYMMIKSPTFNMPYNEKNSKQEIIIITVVLIFIAILMWASATSKKQDKIYYRLVDSIIEGQTSLTTEPPEELALLDNPYDATARSGIKYLWDVAYYKDSYYVYFGILPALLIYIPVKLLTGITLKLNTGILIFTILTTVNLTRILIFIFKKWFKNLSFNYLILSIIGTVSGSLLFWVNRRPMVYELVVTAGICFSLEGTYLMLKALYSEDNIKYKNLILGTLCLALAVACRPNHLLISLIFVPKLLNILIKNIKEKNNVLKFICSVGIPYLIVGTLLMIYNYMRFDSIFEFGTSYQLTVNDMRNLSYRLLTIPVGIITQLFKLPVTTNQFPFYAYQHSTIPFFGYYFVQSLVCGLFVLNPINLILLFLIKLKKKIKEKEAYSFTCILTVVAIIICIANIVLAGTLQRYSMDYAWILNIASYLTLFIIVSNIKSEEIKKYILIFAIIITLYMLISNFIVGAVVSEENLLEKICPTQYYGIRYGICFWE